MHPLRLLAGAAALFAAVSCTEDSTSPGNGNGTVVVRMTDAPFPTSEVRSVNVFVVRVEGRTTAATDAEADANLDNGSTAGWSTLATPNATYDLLTLQNGAAVTLGTASIPAGTYNGFRLVIDPTKSSVTLADGRVLTSTSSPDVSFPSASRSGIKILLTSPLQVVAGATTTFLIDFNLDESFVLRGNSIASGGLNFRPVIRGSVTDAVTVNANVRLVNASGSSLDFLKSGTVLTGGSNLAFASNSACTSVNAATSGLTVTQTGTTTPLTGFAPTLTAGTSYTLVAYPTATGGVQFATLSNTFTPTSGQSGLRVFNATGVTTGFDAFVTASGAALGTATVSNVLAGGSSSFVSLAAGSSQVRLTATGTQTVLLDLGTVSLTAGQNATLIIAPPATGSTTFRAFVVPGC